MILRMKYHFEQFDRPLALIFLLALLLRSINLIQQPPLPDEVQMAFSAENYITRGQLGPTSVFHPNLRNILIYFSGHLFGYSAFGLRVWSYVFGSLAVLLLGLIGSRLFISKNPGYFAALFLALDGLHIMYSRNPLQPMTGLFFSLLGVYCWIEFSRKKKIWHLIISGVSFGIGIAAIWLVVFPLVFCFVVSIIKLLRGKKIQIISKTFAFFSMMMILPVSVYLISFIPWITRGYRVKDWLFLQIVMYQGVSSNLENIMMSVGQSNGAYQWFVQPIANTAFGSTVSGDIFITSGVCNPFVWMLIIPAVAFLGYVSFKKRDEKGGVVVGLFLISYLPLLFAGRLIFAHSALFVLPYGLLAVGFLITTLIRVRPISKAYVIGAIIIGLALYPLAIGAGMKLSYLQPVVSWLKPPHELFLVKPE